jgi:hypothetical protein
MQSLLVVPEGAINELLERHVMLLKEITCRGIFENLKGGGLCFDITER